MVEDNHVKGLRNGKVESSYAVHGKINRVPFGSEIVTYVCSQIPVVLDNQDPQSLCVRVYHDIITVCRLPR